MMDGAAYIFSPSQDGPHCIFVSFRNKLLFYCYAHNKYARRIHMHKQVGMQADIQAGIRLHYSKR